MVPIGRTVQLILWIFVWIHQLQSLKAGSTPFRTSQPKPINQPQKNGNVQARQASQSDTVTCTCVPTGQCSSTVPSDGSGQIDIRIVNGGNTSTTTSTSTATTIISTTPTTSPITCQTALVQCCQYGPYRCGVRYPPIAGSPNASAGQASYGEYPWQAALLTTNNVYIGSGALIDSRNVLTAAHKISTVSLSTIRVRLGEWDASSTTEPIPAQEYTVTTAFINPNFNANNLRNDIAILRLSTAVPLGQTPTIATICLPATTFVGQTCWVSGWGKNDFGSNGTFQSIQKEVDVTVRSSSNCQSTLSATRLGSNFVFDNTSFICAGGDAGKDACTGDGGSPLVCQLGSRWFVAGLVAWGIGCGVQGVPGVYVNVLTYLPWIQTILTT